MSFELSIPYTTATNYTYDTSKIQVTGGKASLKLGDNTGQAFTQAFTSDSGFTYDATKAEFTGGQVQQLDKAPTDSTCWATYTTDINLNYGGGTLTGAATGGAAASGGYLDLTGGTAKHVDYDGTSNVDALIQTGAIKFIVKPGYTGTPAGIRNFIVISEASGDVSNLINIYQKSSDGNIKIVINNQTTGTIMSEDMGAWSPTAGTDYEMELNFIIDTAIGGNTYIRFFIDGTQFGATKTGVTGTRSSNIGLIRIGTNVGTGDTADHSVKDIIFFDAVQHTANYTAGYTLEEARYLGSKVDLPQFSYSGPGSVQGFTALAETKTDTPKYTLNSKYWNGSIWASSDGSYSQATSGTDANTNIAALTESDTLDVSVIFDDSNIQSAANNLVITYTGQKYPIDNPVIETNATFSNEGLDGFTEASTIAGSDAIKHILKKGSTWYYWDGSAWVVSDETYSQSNTAAEIETNKATFTAVGVTSKVKSFLHSNDGSTTPDLDQLTILYDFYGGDVSAPSICVVFGFIYDENGDPLQDVTIRASLDSKKAIYNGSLVVCNDQQTATSSATGYWELNLVNSDDLNGEKYTFTFFQDNHSRTYIRQVPNETSKNFALLED